jgi:predicted transcriptional regulator
MELVSLGHTASFDDESCNLRTTPRRERTRTVCIVTVADASFAPKPCGTDLAAAFVMDFFDRPVVSYMSPFPETAKPDTPVNELAATLHARGISAIPILEGDDLVGVVSRTDLIQLGALQTGRRWTSPAMPLPARRAKDVMTRQPRAVGTSTSLRAAAAIMSNQGIHRVFVLDENGRLAGVLSTRDLAEAIGEARIETPISAVMTSPIVSLDVKAPLGAAIELLARVTITGAIVTDEDRPVGVFTQIDALAARDLPRATPIETIFDAAVICLPQDTKLHRAAAHAAQLDVRRVVVCRDREAVGVVSGLDFARIAAGLLS